MKKAKQTLTAALAATLATGALGTVAGASPLDDTFASTLKSVQKAQSEKTQTSINEARVAINAMPKELDWAKGEFSKQVDQVQQPLYTQIIDLIEKGKKEAKQETINEGRKLLVGVEDAYAKTWSSDFDTIQQTLIKNTTDAVKAAKSQKAEDIKKATDLVAELKTSTNEDTKKEAEKLEKELNEVVNVYAVKADAKNASTIEVTFSKEVEKDSVDKTDFTLVKGQQKVYVKEAVVSEDKKTVTLTLSTDLKDKEEYKLTVDGIKDSKGNKGNKTELAVKYEKQEISKVEYKSTNVLRGADLKKDNYLVIKDTADRDITKEAKVKFTCVEDKNLISKDGKISGSATLKKEYTIRILDANDTVVSEQTIKIVNKLDVTFVGYTLTLAGVDDDAKYKDIAPNSQIELGTDAKLTIFYTDALGKEQKVEGKDCKVTIVDKGVVSLVGENKIRALKEGHAVVKVVYGSMEQEIDIEATKDAVNDFELTVNDVVLADADVYAPLEVKNNNKLIGAKDASILKGAVVKMRNQQYDRWYNVDSYVQDGQVWLNGHNLKSGTAKLVLNSAHGSKEYEFDVKVEDAGKINNYLVEARKEGDRRETVDEIDLYKNESAQFHVYAIDENGLRVREVSSSNVSVTAIDGSDLNTPINPAIVNKSNLFGKDGSVLFTVEYKELNGGTDSQNMTLTVKNSYDKAVSVRVKDDRDITTNDTLRTAIEFYYGNIYDGSAISSANITNIKAVDLATGNDIDPNANLKTTGDTKRTVRILSIDVNGVPYQVNANLNLKVKEASVVSTKEQRIKELKERQTDLAAQIETLTTEVKAAQFENSEAQKEVARTSQAAVDAKLAYDAEKDKVTSSSFIKVKELQDKMEKADKKYEEAQAVATKANDKLEQAKANLDVKKKLLSVVEKELEILQK